VVEYDVLAVSNTDGIFARSSAFSHTDRDVSHDRIVGVGQRPPIPIYYNSLKIL
jgi:hypothetical protein